MPDTYSHIVSNRGECLRLLVAAGFSRDEIADIQARDQVHSVACSIVALLQRAVIKTDSVSGYFGWEMPHGDPFAALAQMPLDEKKKLRAEADFSFDDFAWEEP